MLSYKGLKPRAAVCSMHCEQTGRIEQNSVEGCTFNTIVYYSISQQRGCWSHCSFYYLTEVSSSTRHTFFVYPVCKEKTRCRGLTTFTNLWFGGITISLIINSLYHSHRTVNMSSSDYRLSQNRSQNPAAGLKALSGFGPKHISDLLLRYELSGPLGLSGTGLLSVPGVKKLNMEKQRSVVMHHTPGTNSQKTAGPLQLSPLLNQG